MNERHTPNLDRESTEVENAKSEEQLLSDVAENTIELDDLDDADSVREQTRQELKEIFGEDPDLYVIEEEFGRAVRQKVSYGGAIDFTFKTPEGRTMAATKEDIVRTLTGNQELIDKKNHVKLEVGASVQTDNKTIQKLKALGIEASLAVWHTGRDAFEQYYSAQDEDLGEFEPRKFLQQNNTPEGRREFMQKFWGQIQTVTDVVETIENSEEGSSYQELIRQTLGKEDINKKLSQEQKFRIKREMFNLVVTEKRIEELINKYPEAKELASYLGEGEIKPIDIKGNITLEKTRSYIAFYVEQDSDYELLEGLEEGDKKSGGHKKVVLKGVPVVFIRGSSGDYAELVHIHEKRHVKNDFLIPEEDNKILQRAKDEILAFLSDGTSLSRVKEILTNSDGLYTYNLKGEQWEQHCQEVEKYINIASQMDSANLDVLAMFPLRHWRHLNKYMNLFTHDKTSQNVMQNFERTRVKKETKKEEVLAKIKTQNYSLTEAKNEFSEFFSDEYDDSDSLDTIIEEYVFGETNQAMNLNRSIEELVEELELLDKYIEVQIAWEDYEEEGSGKVLGDKYYSAILSKLFKPLTSNNDSKISKIGNKLIESQNNPCTLDDVELNTWKEKIGYAKKLIDGEN